MMGILFMYACSISDGGSTSGSGVHSSINSSISYTLAISFDSDTLSVNFN